MLLEVRHSVTKERGRIDVCRLRGESATAGRAAFGRSKDGVNDDGRRRRTTVVRRQTSNEDEDATI